MPIMPDLPSADDLPSFDDLYVISDLHMGGEPGFQILQHTNRLAGFIHRLASQTPERRLALVLNGDVIDTLAEDKKTVPDYVAMQDAPQVVAGIIDRDAFSGIWQALVDFVRTPNRHLVIVIGNHDIELALPAVQRMLTARLVGDKPAARAQLEFSTTGGGYPCKVGDKRVFCTHGNETDAWNYNRYEALAQLGRHVDVGKPLDNWQANAGTRIVKEVMNEVKTRYKWIDLLKPENKAMLGGVLLTLDPRQARKLADIIAILPDRVTAGFDRDSRLGGAEATPADAPVSPFDQMLGPHLQQLRPAQGASPAPRADDMLLAAESALQDGLGASSANESTLGSFQLIWDRMTGWLTGMPKEEALRRALLDWLDGDRSFDPTYGKQADDKAIVASIAFAAADFIVAGHIHLARDIDLGNGRRYLNSGTWIRLIHLTPTLLDDSAVFRTTLYPALDKGGMADLDECTINGEPLILDRTTAVRIYKDAEGATHGELRRVTGDGSTDEALSTARA